MATLDLKIQVRVRNAWALQIAGVLWTAARPILGTHRAIRIVNLCLRPFRIDWRATGLRDTQHFRIYVDDQGRIRER